MICRALFLLGLVASASTICAEPLVLAAASTNRAVDAALAESGIEAVTSYAASGVLARQIEAGVPADLFISANPKWMEYLVEAGLVEATAVSVLMSNALVLVAPEDAPPWESADLSKRLEDGVFAMADPNTAPVGAYGQAALHTLGLWSDLSVAFVPMRNTLATVAAVAEGEAALGLVYASDAAGQPVQVLWEIPVGTHPAIEYLIAPIAQGDDRDGGAALADYLVSTQAASVLAAHGFLVDVAP